MQLAEILINFDYSGGDEATEIQRCLSVLYQTPEGSCPLDREFGLSQEMLGFPADVAQNGLALEILEKTKRYEPRATIGKINFQMRDDGSMEAEVMITDG